MRAGRRTTSTTPPEDTARAPLARRFQLLLLDVVQPVLRWRVEKPNGELVHAFPAHQAKDEEAARALAKERLSQVGAWRESYRVVGIR